MFKSIYPKAVLIQSAEVKKEGTLEKTEMTLEKEMKKQNRGTVVMVGEDVKWPKEQDVVSYFRGAATDITDDDGTVYQLVNAAHILAEF